VLGRRLLATTGHGGGPWLERLALRSQGKVVLVQVRAIDWIDALGGKTRVNAAGQSHLASQPIGALAERLPPETFLRIHRSTIVNVERIRELQTTAHGDLVLVLAGRRRLAVGRSYRDEVHRRLEG